MIYSMSLSLFLYDQRSSVIKLDGGGSGDAFQKTDGDWNDTQRVAEFWYKGGFDLLLFKLTTTGGQRNIYFYSSSGTNYANAYGHVFIFLGTASATTSWKRFEENLQALYDQYSQYDFQNVDGIIIYPSSTLSYDMYVDRLQFSNATTTEYNSLQGGSVGQIAAQYTFSGGYTGITKKWMHYDRLGNLINKSGTTGFGTDVYYQDAYGNVLSSVYTGAWASNPSGRHLTTKEIDGDVPLYYFGQRWYDLGTGRFISRDPLFKIGLPMAMPINWIRAQALNPYLYGIDNPLRYIDPLGGCSADPGGGGGRRGGGEGPKPYIPDANEDTAEPYDFYKKFRPNPIDISDLFVTATCTPCDTSTPWPTDTPKDTPTPDWEVEAWRDYVNRGRQGSTPSCSKRKFLEWIDSHRTPSPAL